MYDTCVCTHNHISEKLSKEGCGTQTRVYITRDSRVALWAICAKVCTIFLLSWYVCTIARARKNFALCTHQ